MKTLDLDQITVETFEVGTQGGPYMPIVSTDQFPFCQGGSEYC